MFGATIIICLLIRTKVKYEQTEKYEVQLYLIDSRLSMARMWKFTHNRLLHKNK